MPAQSQQQQKLFGLALSVKRGETPRSEASDEVLNIVDSMSEKQIKDFAETSHSGLPAKVEQQVREALRELMREMAIEEAELPNATIPANIKAKLAQAIDKIKDTNLNYNQKLQVIGRVVDSLGVDKKELAKMSSKLKTTLESINEADPCWKGYQQIGMKKKNGKEVPNCVPESVNEAVPPQTKWAIAIASLTATRPDAVQKFIDDNNLNSEKLYSYLKKGKLSDRMDLVTAIAGKPGNPIQKKMIKMFGESVNESHFKLGDSVTCIKSGMSGQVIGLDKEHGGEDEKYYKVKREDGEVVKYSPNELKLNESVNEDTKKRFDVDFYKNSITSGTSHEEIIRGDKFSDVVSQATKVAKSKGMDYVEFYYKDAFIGSIARKNNYTFKKGRHSDKSPLSVNEASYNFGKEEYTKKNLTPTQIFDLAMAYANVAGKGNPMYNNKMENMIKVANDLAKLTGKKQMNPNAKGSEPALILFLLKNKLVTQDEYVKLYKNLSQKHISVAKALRNADPASRMIGGAAARQAYKDMKGEFEESVVNEDANMNKKVKALLDKELNDLSKGRPNHQFAVMHILMGALTDANFHSDAKKVPSIFPRAKYEGDPQGEKDLIDMYEYEIGPKIANICKWDGKDIVMAIGFYVSMTIGRPVGEKVEKLVESVTEGKKVFKVNPAIGKAKYSISSHDGVKKHKDGSDFFDIETFKNKVDLEKAIKNYTSKGFKMESVNEIQYKDAVAKFNDELIKHPMVKKAAQHYKKTPAEIVKVLQQRLYTKGDKGGDTKEVFIDFKDTVSGIEIKHKMKFNESHDCGCGCGGATIGGCNTSIVEDFKAVVGKTVFSDGKGKAFFGYYKEDDSAYFVDYKTWAKLGMKDVSKGDTNKNKVLAAILRNQKQFNKKVDYNMWHKKTNPTFEQSMDYFIKNGFISNITKAGIKVD